MKVLIDVRNEIVEDCKERVFENALFEETDIAIKNGIVLDGLTNGEVMMKMFPNNRVDIVMGKVYFYTHVDEDEDFDKYAIFDFDWWNGKWGKTE